MKRGREMSIEEIAEKHKIDVSKIEEQLAKGIKVEHEHTDNEDEAKKIAMDHLAEMPDYYDKLSKIEKKNAQNMPKVYYAKHIKPGLCGYNDETILLRSDALKKMDATFAGKPVVVIHQEIDKDFMDNLQERADGFVSESFYNEVDGSHWLKFIAISDKCHEFINKGWAVSNAYMPIEVSSGGTEHNIPYDREFLDGSYTHLAIVPDPRYEDAKILSPEEFKKYNEQKKKEIEELRNSKGKKGGLLMFWKKTKVEAPEELLNAVTSIDGKDVSVQEMIDIVKNAKEVEKANAEKEEKEKEEKMNMDSEVDVGDEKMSVKELINKYQACMKKNAEDEEEKKKAEEKANAESEDEAKKKEEKEEKENEEDEEEKKKEKENAREADKNFHELLNAKNIEGDVQVIETDECQLERGASKYGS